MQTKDSFATPKCWAVFKVMFGCLHGMLHATCQHTKKHWSSKDSCRKLPVIHLGWLGGKDDYNKAHGYESGRHPPISGSVKNRPKIGVITLTRSSDPGPPP